MFSCVDHSTLSNSTKVVVTHTDLIWELDFENRVIRGNVEHSMRLLFDIKNVHFDTENIDVDAAWINDDSSLFNVNDSGKPHHLGRRLSIAIPKEFQFIGSEFKVKFKYSICDKSIATQWLDAASTKGGLYPYLFTQSFAIHSRSLFPCMDTPSVKATFTAKVSCPKWCTVLMSGLLLSTDPSPTDESSHIFTWHQAVPVPAYLVALAAGNLVSRDISERVRIWAEPEVVEAAFFEFAETEAFLCAAEDITGLAYQWGRYDVLCLPPSFPYGGTENPCLTFVTPTLLAGDRSLADVIAHEIAHSWTGNLVTNHTWSHFWLNEGWTMWLERKITARVRHNDEYFLLSAQSGYKLLQDEIALAGEDGPWTSLVWPLSGQDPDEAFSTVPYEKGFNLLYYLETVVGGVVFAAFAQAYINKFKFSTVTSGDFRDHFLSFVNAPSASFTVPEGVLRKVGTIDWDELLLSKGMPRHPAADFSNSLSEASLALAARWIGVALGGVYSAEDFSPADIQGWSTLQITIFLDALLTHLTQHNALSNTENEEESEVEAVPAFSTSLLRLMDDHYLFTSSFNAEVVHRWFALSVGMDCDWVIEAALSFVISQGRMKFVRPLYRTLLASRWRDRAMQTFDNNQQKYHPIARKMVAADMKVAREAIDVEKREQQEEMNK